jgi:hypothetical protein
MLAGKPASYQPLTALGAIDLAQEVDAAAAALLARYPALTDLEGDDFRQHPQRPRYLLEYELYAIRIPALRAAWAGDGEAPTAEAIATSPQADVLAGCREVRRLNPYLTDLPAPPEPEGDRPND